MLYTLPKLLLQSLDCRHGLQKGGPRQGHSHLRLFLNRKFLSWISPFPKPNNEYPNLYLLRCRYQGTAVGEEAGPLKAFYTGRSLSIFLILALAAARRRHGGILETKNLQTTTSTLQHHDLHHSTTLVMLPSIGSVLLAGISLISAQAVSPDPQLVGTWSSKSNKTLTGSVRSKSWQPPDNCSLKHAGLLRSRE